MARGPIRRDLPEEFWTDFDAITALLEAELDALVVRIKTVAEGLAGLSDKEIGLWLPELPADVRGFVFPYRKSGGDLLAGRSRQVVFRTIRPTGNQLAGYMPSYAITRVIEEEA